MSPKIGFFLWIIAHGRLATRDMLLRRGMDVSGNCIFCSDTETASHLFLHRAFAKMVWDCLTCKLKWFYAMPADMVPAIQAWQLNLSDKDKFEIWRMVPIAIIWCLWKERNNKIFKDEHSTAIVVASKERENTTCDYVSMKEVHTSRYITSSCH